MKRWAVYLWIGLGLAASGCGTENPFDRGEPFGDDPNLEPDAIATFQANIKPILQPCTSCHAAGAGGWTYDGGLNAYNQVISQVNTGSPAESPLLVNATGGSGHGGGTIFSAVSPEYQALVSWIEDGAQDN